MALGAFAGCAAPGMAEERPKTLFTVANTTIPVVGMAEVFPVRRIYCIGRNYAAHAIERGSDPTREPPFFFQKPTDAVQLVPEGRTIDHPYPQMTKNYHHEIELVAALGRGGRNIPADKALESTAGAELRRLPCSSARARADRRGACKGRFATVNRESCIPALGRKLSSAAPTAMTQPLHRRHCRGCREAKGGFQLRDR
jgi:hypothetical protein